MTLKERFKDNLIYFGASTKSSIISIRNELFCPSKRTMAIILSIAVIMAIGVSTNFAGAADGDVWSGINNALNTVYSKLFGITTLLAVVCIVIGLLGAMLTPNQQKTAQWIDFAKKALIVWLIINCLLWIFNFFKTVVAGGGSGDLENFK